MVQSISAATTHLDRVRHHLAKVAAAHAQIAAQALGTVAPHYADQAAPAGQSGPSEPGQRITGTTTPPGPSPSGGY